MQYVLCYGDSNTWGCVPETFERYDFPVRWPGVMQRELGNQYHIYENAMNGRTTVFEDPIEEGRNGRTGLETLLMVHAPLDSVVLMLGTNDVKDRHGQSPWDIAWGVDLLITIIEKSGCGRDGSVPEILLVSPIHLNNDWGSSLHYTVFSEQSIEKSKQLATCYHKVAQLHQCAFFDAATVAHAEGDGVHMSTQSHEAIGKALASEVRQLLHP
jgi:lysophospholipase L1-like esterase